MSITPSPSQSDTQAALRSFLLSVLPSGVEVIEAQDNRVPEPAATSFVVMTPIHRNRISTNIDAYVDCSFTASISGTVMTVTHVNFGTIVNGNAVFGVGVATGTVITSFGTGTGGVGTYNLNISQTVASEKMANGATQFTMPVDVVYQLDFHSATPDAGASMAQCVTTIFRDLYATDYFATLNAGVTPLYADEPRQVPFMNAEQQYETRWTADVHLQVNAVVSLPQQFADQLYIGLVPVDIFYKA